MGLLAAIRATFTYIFQVRLRKIDGAVRVGVGCLGTTTLESPADGPPRH
jgi:hypothetical protein